MITFNDYCKQTFGEKLYKISLNGGFTCPNRDGNIDTRGCIFCSAGGSGDFAADKSKSIEEQIHQAKKLVADKYKGNKYIAYFQAYTNTYAPENYLRKIYTSVLQREDIAALSIATRPDCISEEVYELIADLCKIKPVFVELGLQTVNANTAKYIRRGFDTECYNKAIEKLNSIGVHTVTHVILGLPGETEEDMLKTVQHVVKMGSCGIKLQLLHVLRGTDLAKDYIEGKFKVMSLEEYVAIVKKCVEILPSDMVVHRLTGDGPKKLLIAPLWSGDKKTVLNAINKAILGE